MARHWNHVDKFRFHAPIPGGFFVEAINYIDDNPGRAVDLKIAAYQNGLRFKPEQALARRHSQRSAERRSQTRDRAQSPPAARAPTGKSERRSRSRWSPT